MGKTMKNSSLKAHIGDIFSFAGLLLCVIVFSILSKGKLWSAYNLGVLVQQTCVYAILAMGAVFIYSMGYMDISLGAQVGVYCLLLILITNASGSLILGFVSILAIAILCGLINGYVSFFKQMPVMLAAIVIVAIISIFLYQFTQLGKLTKGIGANETATSISGVNTTKWKVLAYVFFGVCIAVGALFLTARTNSAGKGTGAGYAMDIMVSLLLGGMPLSGGMRSKISAALVGTFTYVILANGLILSGVSTTLIYIIKAIVFMAVILMTCRKKDGVLPR